MPKKERSIDPAVFIVLAIVLILGSVVGVILYSVQTDELTDHLAVDGQFPVYMLIHDGDRLITSQLLLIDSASGNFAVYDVPRKLGAIIPSLGRVDRIDNLYRELGAGEVASTIESIVNYPVPFIMDVDLEDISVLVDTIDGITVFLPEAIEEDGTSGENGALGEPLRIPGGNVLLDGEKIAQYLNYEGEEERELEWISRRWTFVREFWRGVADYPLLTQRDSLFDRFYRHSGANFDRDAMTKLLEIMTGLDYDGMITQRILGNERMVDTGDGEQQILFPHFEGQLLRDSVKQVLGSLGSAEASYGAALSARLEILNGTDINGLAARTEDLYQNFGFSVVRVGNADTNEYDTTVIIDRSGIPEAAARVGGLIRSDNIIDGPPLGDTSEVDITIILGSDFDGWYVNADGDDTEE